MSPYHGDLLGSITESPSTGARGKTPSADRQFFERAVPRLCSQWPWCSTYTQTSTVPTDHIRPGLALVPWFNPHMARILSTQVPSSLQAFVADISMGLKVNGACGASALLEESKCLSNKASEG